MRSLGLCIGSSSIGYVIVDNSDDNVRVIDNKSINHEGKPREALKKLLTRDFLDGIEKMAATGRKFRYAVKARSIAEPEALENAYKFLNHKYPGNVIVSAGAETVMVYQIDKRSRIIDVATGNKCASGTGEFFLQQLKRMNITLEQAVSIPEDSEIYKVSGRCSVFCKSDCTHALNKGVAKEKVVAGLSEMAAGKICELLKKIELKNENRQGKIMPLIVGGSAKNAAMLNFIRKRFPELSVPEYFDTFEALGASLWALENDAERNKDEDLIAPLQKSFKSHKPLKEFAHLVTFKGNKHEAFSENTNYILGLDVGSTTTKAALINADSSYGESGITASSYLRTNGDPVRAARECYAELLTRTSPKAKIIGLGVTGSGRQIAGLHALTPSVINEIIAHAMAAAFYDKKVDTIFEIGGQDAKYTYLTAGVASDYAMNEACSAGTGSFLEEAAKESLNISTEEIGDIALQSENPTNFSDQCAAFINSDIKSAIQEGIPMTDITAGLVYSICENYGNRVKGPRAVGNKVFMQGGVCYNKAVPVAMAALTGKEIIVPPDPGLMGAFGVALDVKNKIALGMTEAMEFNLEDLAGREVVYKDSFICAGGKEKCDRKCEINRMAIEGKIYPFGGACDRYYNLLQKKAEINHKDLDLVRERERLVFSEYSVMRSKIIDKEQNRTVGINRSLMTNTYYPLYYVFFRGLGYDIETTDEVSDEGIDKTGSSFCFPVEISHGVFDNLVKKNPDIYFMPNVKSVWVPNSDQQKVACPFVHAESNYLKATFPEIEGKAIFNPTLDFAYGFEKSKYIFLKIAKKLGHDRRIASRAYDLACRAQTDMLDKFKQIGRKQIREIEESENDIGIILFGRPYNAFTKLGNKGIPHKFASRGYRIIPCDFIDFQEEESPEHVYWGMAETITKGAKFIRRHPSLFGAYITNFSCGPDSFTVNYFRNELGHEPSLTLELDNHTADAGLDTRIEAFIDVVNTYREQLKLGNIKDESEFQIAKVERDRKKLLARDSAGKLYKMTDPKVKVLIPSMNDLTSRCFAAVLRKAGIRSEHVPDPGEEEFKIGLGHTAGKECLPAIVTTGSLLNYIHKRKNDDELLVYFMPGDSGPCRFGSYYVMMQNLVRKLRIKDVAFLNLSQEDGYVGFSTATTLQIWQSILITDVMEYIYSAVLVLAKDREKALSVFTKFGDDLVSAFEKGPWSGTEKTMKEGVKKLAALEKIAKVEDVPKIGLINEMYVRRNNFSRKWIVEKLAGRGIITLVGPLHEWLYYLDMMVRKKMVQNATPLNRLEKIIEKGPKRYFEKKIKGILAKSGFYEYKLVDTNRILNSAKRLVTPTLICESILITGQAISDSIEEVDGLISIQPFGCMPGRIAEAIVARKLDIEKLVQARDKELVRRTMDHFPHLPFLTLEMDGQAMSLGLEAKIETFCLQVERLHQKAGEIRKELA